MSSNYCIIPECYIDSCLVEVLLQADNRSRVNHKKGNGTVTSRMGDDFGDNFCIGIIDEDREPLDFLRDECVVKVENNHLKLWKHKGKHHYIIQLRPVVEKWIISVCVEGNISLKNHGLPDGWKRVSKNV